MPISGPNQSRSLESLISELESAYHQLPWVDEAEERFELKQKIVRHVKAEESGLTRILQLLDHHYLGVCAAKMLGWIGNKNAVKPLLARLWREPAIGFRGTIALALQRIGTPEGRAAHDEYAQTIRSYPEIVGEVAESAKLKGMSSQEVLDAARRNQTYGICIEDADEVGALSFDLCDIMAIVGHRARDSQWCCRWVECTGNYASEMHAIADRGLIVSGRTMAHIALLLDQTIDGEYFAFGDDGDAWLVVRAVDSSLFDVLSREPPVLEEIRSHFCCVKDLDMTNF